MVALVEQSATFTGQFFLLSNGVNYFREEVLCQSDAHTTYQSVQRSNNFLNYRGSATSFVISAYA